LISELDKSAKHLQQLAELLSEEGDDSKRIYDRLRYRIPLECSIYQLSLESDKVPETYGKIFKSIAKDISAGGLMFEGPYLLPMGSILKMKLDMSFNNRYINCLVRIIRLEEVKDDGKYVGRYNVGVCFLDISSEDKAFIDKFVQAEHEIMKKQILWK
jgi:hypothetical protein